MLEHVSVPNDPIQLAQSLAMSLSITDSARFELIEMLHELAEHRRRAREPLALPEPPDRQL
jgi:hypothetical protein